MLVITRTKGKRLFIGTGDKKIIINFLRIREDEPVTMSIEGLSEIDINSINNQEKNRAKIV